MERQLDNFISKLEQQKQALKMDPSYAQYAYVTHDDLKQLNFSKKSGLPEGPDDQNLLLAIQTPHGSLLNIFQTKEPVSSMPSLGTAELSQLKMQGALVQEEEYSELMGYLKERYHLVIDAESAQKNKAGTGSTDEPITVY